MALTYTYLCKGTTTPDASKLPSGGIYFNTDNKKIYLNNEGSLITYDGNNTKNTAGSSDTSSKIFLVGATSQASSATTYSHDTAYVGTDGCLYSGGTKVLTSHQTVVNGAPTLAWNTTSTVATIGGTDITVKLPANPNTDKTVEQMRSNTDNWRPLILSSHYGTYGKSPSSTTFTNNVYYRESIAANPTTGTIKAIDFAGSLNTTIYTNSSLKTIYQAGNIAGAKAFKITERILNSNGTGTYTLRPTEDIAKIKAGMKYVACTSEMNAVGGEIVSVEGNTVTVNGYLDVPTHKEKYNIADNPDTGDVYDYLIIVEDSENLDFVPGSIGDTEIGYGAAALGNGSVVLAKNGFSTAKNGKVLGKYGSVGGKDTKAGHCARADGDRTRALGSCSSTDGSETEATGFGARADGVKTKAPAYASKSSGLGTKTERQAQHVCGQYNASDPNAYFVVGCGTSDNNRGNAFSAGFYNGEPFIKVGSTYMSRTWFGKLVTFAQNISNYAKKSDVPNVLVFQDFKNRVSALEADWKITEGDEDDGYRKVTYNIEGYRNHEEVTPGLYMVRVKQTHIGEGTKNSFMFDFSSGEEWHSCSFMFDAGKTVVDAVVRAEPVPGSGGNCYFKVFKAPTSTSLDQNDELGQCEISVKKIGSNYALG